MTRTVRASASLRQKSAFLLGDRIWIITQQDVIAETLSAYTLQSYLYSFSAHTFSWFLNTSMSIIKSWEMLLWFFNQIVNGILINTIMLQINVSANNI
jgi:hypothetical protein